jgi:hypothetical protein
MAMAANGIFQWDADGASAPSSSKARTGFSPAALSSPRDVAGALFDELGLSRFLAPAATAGERLIRDIEHFAARRTPENPATPAAKPIAAPRAVSGLFAPAPRPAAQAIPASVACAPAAPLLHVADPVAPERGGAGVVDAIARPDADAGSGADDAATGEGSGWLGLDMSQPREWSAEDLAMLMFRDRAAAADSLSLRAEQAAAEVAESLDAFIDPYAFDDDASEEPVIAETVMAESAIKEPTIDGRGFADRAAA